MNEERVRVLLVDDEASLRIPLKQYLEKNFGYCVDAAADSQEALRFAQENQGRYDVALIDEVLLILIDEMLPDGADGIQLMRKIKARYPDIETIIFTGWGRESRQRAIQAGAFRYLEKPFDHDELAMVIRMAAQQVRLRTISREILSEKDPGQVLESIMVAACSLALADEASIVLLDWANGRLHVHAKNYPAGPQWYRHFKDQNLSREIMQRGQVVWVPDASQDKRVNTRVIDAGIRAFLGLPIPGEGDNLGVLYVYSQRKGWFEEWGTVAVLQTLAGQAGLALANAQAFQQIDTHARYMEALVRAGQGLTWATWLEDQLALAWSFVREQLQTSTFFVALYDRQRRILRFPLAYDEGKRITITDKQEGEEWGISGHVIRSGKELVWPTAEQKRQECQILGIEPIEIGKPCQSCIYLPLGAGDQVTGAISIQSYSPHAFPPVLLNAFRALGSQLAVALENTRLFAELAEAKEWREALIENAFDAVIAIDQERRVTVFNRRAEEMFGWAAEEMIGRTVARLHTDVRKAQEIFDLVNREGAIPEWEVELKHRQGDQIPALLSATQIRDSQGIPKGQAGFIQDLRQAHLLEDRLRAMIQVNKAITETLDLDQVLQRVIESAMLAFPAADGGSLHLYDERTDLLQVRSNTFGYSEAAIEASHFQAGEGIAGWVFQHDQPTVVDDVERDPRHKNIAHPEVPAHKSMICVPLRVREQVIGTLTLDNLAITGAFQAEDLGLLSTFADQAAIAYANARRMRELEHMRKAAEAMAGVHEPSQVLEQIVSSAREVFRGDSSAIWSYDGVRNQFIPDALAASGIPKDKLERFREKEPKGGGTADTVMNQGRIEVRDISNPQYDFMGSSTLELLESIGARSFQGAALNVGVEKLGVLYVNYNHPRSFSREESTTLETFANHAALALKKARLFEQVGKAGDAARSIASVMTLEDLPTTLESIVEATRQVTDCDAVTLFAYDQDADEFIYPPTTSELWDEKEVRWTRPVPRDSVVWKILSLDRPHMAEDAQNDPLMKRQRDAEYPPFVIRQSIVSSMGLPLRAGERKVGVMFVNFRSAHRFTSDEIATIQLFADQAAVAIRNAQLYSETSRLCRQAQLIADISRETARTLELDAFLQTLFVHLTQIFQERGIPVYPSLATYDDETASLAFHETDFYPEKPQTGPVSLDTPGIIPWVAKTRKPYYAPDVSCDEHYLGLSPETRSEVAVPILFGKQLLGVLDLECPVLDAFAPKDRQLLQTLANQLATTIRNVQQYEDLRRTRGLVGARTALAWMGMASTTWRHAIDKHALTIREQAQLLRQDWQSISRHPGDAKVPKRIATIERLANQILDRPITPPLSTEEGMESVPLNTLVGERAKQLWQNDPYRRAELRLEIKLSEQATVRASPEWLRRAFDILVDNAVDAVVDRSVRKITISTQQMDGGAEILVSDTGSGIPEEIRAKIGLELIEKPEDAQGLGMGLLMAQTIVQTCGGEIRVDSTGPEGTTMVIWLPLEKQTR